MKEFTVKFNLCDSEYMTALRLVCGAVCSVHGLNVDDSEDFKVCVTESAIILKNCGFDTCTVTFREDNGLYCEVSGAGGSPKEGENELSLALISALVSQCDIEKKGEAINKVTLKA